MRKVAAFFVYSRMDVIELAEKLSKLNIGSAIKKAVTNGAIEAEIIDRNTRGQLGRFINSEGVRLSNIGGQYSVFTQVVKGLGANEVNLNDTGEYWDSFSVKPLEDGFEINSVDKYDLLERYGEDVEGLTDENQEEIETLIEQFIWDNL